MKNILFLLGIALCSTMAAQLQNPDTSGDIGGIPAFANSDGLRNPEDQITNIDVNKIRQWASLTDFDDITLSRAAIEGSVFLFDQWENNGVIEVGDKRYVFGNMNYHVKKATFMTKISEDSIVSFDLSTFDRIVINDKPFKSIYNPSKRANDTFEVIYEGKDLALLKVYSLEITEANPNPMINRSKSKIKKKSTYYLKKGNSIKRFKFKKKNLLELAGNKSADLELYAEKNKLSFKKDDDVRRMFTNMMNE